MSTSKLAKQFSLIYSCSTKRLTVRLEKFTDGVCFCDQMRLKVTEILVGNINVTHLFKKTLQEDPSWWDTNVIGRKNEKCLIINGPDSLEELRQTLAAQPDDQLQLKVVLQGDPGDFFNSLWGIYPEEWNKKVIDVFILQTPCDEINRIIYDRIYEKINSMIEERVRKQGETEERIDLDQLFNLLLRDEIEPYIKKFNVKLDEVEKIDPCFTTFQLLKWLGGEEIHDYPSGRYGMSRTLRGLLDPALNALTDNSSNWERYNFSVKIVGYTDSVPVKKEKIDLEMNETGIPDWSEIENPLDVHYLGCSSDNDKLNGEDPVYIRFGSSEGKQIKEKISNNCELGAVRAYVAAVYMLNKLGRNGVEYSYATGGIAPGPEKNNKRDDPKKRKINSIFILKAAKTDKQS